MDGVALKMLFGDRAKYIGLTFGIAFSTMLMSNQVSIFTGLMLRTASQILDAREADISNYVLDNGNQMSESASGQAGAIISPEAYRAFERFFMDWLDRYQEGLEA